MGYIGSVGAYSDSRGSQGIREEVAKYIEARDGCFLDSLTGSGFFVFQVPGHWCTSKYTCM
jgi:hypothetical protein